MDEWLKKNVPEYKIYPSRQFGMDKPIVTVRFEHVKSVNEYLKQFGDYRREYVDDYVYFFPRK